MGQVHAYSLMGVLLVVLSLTASAADRPLCERAGGVIRGQEGQMSQRMAEYQTEEMCNSRSCEWDRSTSLCHYPGHASAPNITTVHLIQSNHLDVGYTATARDVINQYFTSYFPRAIKVGQELRRANGTERLKWMTQTYLVTLYLNCPVGLGLTCPSAALISAFKASVAAGDITYQAFPHNAELMMLDPSMLTFGVKLTVPNQHGCHSSLLIQIRPLIQICARYTLLLPAAFIAFRCMPPSARHRRRPRPDAQDRGILPRCAWVRQVHHTSSEEGGGHGSEYGYEREDIPGQRTQVRLTPTTL
jgi:hypothetical protein